MEEVASQSDLFAEKLLGALNDGALCLMVSIGHRTGLFDAMEGMGPAGSGEIASQAGLDERYVREWLGAMAVSGVVRCEGDRFELPPEHAVSLTRAAGADNMGVFAQYIAVLGGVEDDIVECFRKGGGVPYQRFPRFHEVMAEESGQSVLSSLTGEILPLADGVVERLKEGIDVLDIGCGSGRALNLMAKTFPASRFVGYDLSQEAIERARVEAAEAAVNNLSFEIRDLSDFNATADVDRFDFVTTFDAIHDQARPLQVLQGVARTLRPGGIYLMQDIQGSCQACKNLDHPLGTFLYTISCMHCMTVSLAQGGEGLGAMWGEETALQYLEQAGFSSVTVHRLPHDPQNNYYVAVRE